MNPINDDDNRCQYLSRAKPRQPSHPFKEPHLKKEKTISRRKADTEVSNKVPKYISPPNCMRHGVWVGVTRWKVRFCTYNPMLPKTSFFVSPHQVIMDHVIFAYVTPEKKHEDE